MTVPFILMGYGDSGVGPPAIFARVDAEVEVLMGAAGGTSAVAAQLLSCDVVILPCVVVLLMVARVESVDGCC